MNNDLEYAIDYIKEMQKRICTVCAHIWMRSRNRHVIDSKDPSNSREEILFGDTWITMEELFHKVASDDYIPKRILNIIQEYVREAL